MASGTWGSGDRLGVGASRSLEQRRHNRFATGRVVWEGRAVPRVVGDRARDEVCSSKQELKEPLARAREMLALARADSASAAPHFDDMARLLDEVDELVDARIGDLSARTRMESELVASEQRLRSVAEHIIGPMIVIDDRGRIVDCNSRALAALGWQYDDLVGRSASTVMGVDLIVRRISA